MLAKAQATVPAEPGIWSYEPKWDGFRALVFRDRDEVVIASPSGKELGRYFPELIESLRAAVAPRCVLDGEVVVPREVDGRVRLDWDSLSQRIHPAQSRIRTLAEATPAHFIGFDALALGDRSLMAEPFRVRRVALVESIADGRWCHITRSTTDPVLAEHWRTTFEGAGLDGVIAKRVDGQYLPGKRDMVKVKHARDADCVVIGYRIHKSGQGWARCCWDCTVPTADFRWSVGRRRSRLPTGCVCWRSWSRCAKATAPESTASPADGTRRRTRPGCRFGQSWSRRLPTTRWRAAATGSASGTWCDSCAGVPTVTRPAVLSANLRFR